MKSQLYFPIILLFIGMSGCMHTYREDNTFPLVFSVKTMKYGETIMFQALSGHSLKKYVFSGIRVDKTNKSCNNSAQSHLTVIWHHYLKKVNNELSLERPVQYGSFEKGKNIKKNVVYTVEVKAKQIINNQFSGKLGIGRGYFVVNDIGKVISASTYPEVENLCQAYGL